MSKTSDPADNINIHDKEDKGEEPDHDGIWMNIPVTGPEDEVLPARKSEDSYEKENFRAYDEVLSYEYKYAPPSAERKEKVDAETPISHYDYDFDEKDYRRHRKLSHHYHEPMRPVGESHHHKHKSRSKKRKSEKKERDKYPKSPQKIQTIKILPQITEHRELTTDDLTDKENEPNVWPKERRDGTKKSHRKKRHQHRHHREISSQDRLELRIRTGIQTLEDEKKAIRNIGGAMDSDSEIETKDFEDIKTHRFEDYKGVRRRSVTSRQKSGMTTHMSDSWRKRSHMKISLPARQYDRNPKEGFVELEELTRGENNELQWKERARWIKFEEDVEKNERWGKPHVASLSFQSLLELRKGLDSGTVLLDLEQFDLPGIFDTVVNSMIITDQLSASRREEIIEVLLSKHRHQHQQSRLARRFSFSSLSSLTMDLSKNEKGEGGLDDTTAKESSGEEKKLTKDFDIERSLDDKIVIPIRDLENEEEAKAASKKGGTNRDGMGPMGYVDQSDVDIQFEAPQFARQTSVRFGPTLELQGESKTESDVKAKVPAGAEATSVLVGTLPDLDQPAVAFVRLARGCFLGNLTEVPIPVRFLFILLGPPSQTDYYEIGRSIATLMSDKIFHDLAYSAKSRDDILAAINSFLDDSIVLAPGDWDRNLLLPLLEAEIASKRRQRLRLLKEKAAMERPFDENPFERTGRLFGGLIRDVKKKSQFFASDFYDGINLRCFVALIFLFVATLGPTITFGGLLSKKTDQWLGAIETILATSVCGALFGLFSGQPLIIVGSTGPILVFEHATYQLCVYFEVEFLPWRFWIGLWVMVILWGVVAFEGCFLVEYFTRFVEEVFSVLISVLFIYEAMYYIATLYKDHPLKSVSPSSNYTYSNGSKPSHKSSATNSPTLQIKNQPNTALMSTMLLLGTFFIAFYLRKVRQSHFFSSQARRIFSDFGLPIAMVLMVIADHTIDEVYTQKIHIPNELRPTKLERRSFFVNPMGFNKPFHVGWIIFSVMPAILVSILLFMETELTGVLINKKKNKLRKGGGYNLDLFMMGLLTGLSSVFGLPWMCAATVRSVQHVNALAVMSRTHAPGERPQLLEIKEQRFTNVAIHLLMGCTVFMGSMLREIPIAVLFGVFLYLGISSLSGMQLVEQVELLLMPTKYHPTKRFVIRVKTRTIFMYTVVQLFCLVALFLIKLSPVAPSFPFFIICMVGIRKLLEKYMSEEELEELDNEEDEEDSEMDEYDAIYMPI